MTKHKKNNSYLVRDKKLNGSGYKGSFANILNACINKNKFEDRGKDKTAIKLNRNFSFIL